MRTQRLRLFMQGLHPRGRASAERRMTCVECGHTASEHDDWVLRLHHCCERELRRQRTDLVKRTITRREMTERTNPKAGQT